MRSQSVAVALTLLNLALLAVVISQGVTAEAQAPPAVLRAQKIELVDTNGQVRGSLEIAGDSEAVLRLRDSSGAIRVKIGGSTEGSGLVLYDDSTEPGVQVVARRRTTAARPTATSVKLLGAGGRERVITP
jgi:hypothetical protein